MWRRLARNAVSNVTGTVVSLAVGFVTLPLVVHALGPTQFGLWALVGGIVGYVGILDLGLAPTLVSQAAALLARDDEAARRRLSGTASTIYGLYAAMGCVAALGLAGVGLVAGALFHVSGEDLATFRMVLLVVGVHTALALPMSVWNGLLSGLQAFHVLNGIGIATTLVRGLLTVVLVAMGHGLVALALSSFLVTTLAWTASRWCVHRRIPGVRVRLRDFRRDGLVEIRRFSAAMFAWAAAGAALHQLDRVLIGIVMPVQMLTTYEVGARLATYSRSILYSWLSIVMPATAALAERGERAAIRALFLRGTRYLLASYAGVVALLLGFGWPLVRLWMGPGFGESYTVMGLLIVGSLFQSQNLVAHVMLPVMGELPVFTRFMLVYPFVTATCAVTGILTGGLTGLAAGTTTSTVVMESVFVAFVWRRFDVTLGEVLMACHWPVAKAALPAVAWMLLAHAIVPLDGWIALSGTVGLAGVFFVAGVWTAAVTPLERRALVARLAALRGSSVVTNLSSGALPRGGA